MSPPRRRSLLEDDDLAEIGRDESSSGDVCERRGCWHEREKHEGDGGCKKCSCEEFVD